MNPYFILGVISCLSPILVVIGLIENDLPFWYSFDAYTIVLFPILGITLIKLAKKLSSKV